MQQPHRWPPALRATPATTTHTLMSTHTLPAHPPCLHIHPHQPIPPSHTHYINHMLIRTLHILTPTQHTSPVSCSFASKDNAWVTDVELLGAWNGIAAVNAHRHYVARVQGQPINIGIFVDATYDIGRLHTHTPCLRTHAVPYPSRTIPAG